MKQREAPSHREQRPVERAPCARFTDPCIGAHVIRVGNESESLAERRERAGQRLAKARRPRADRESVDQPHRMTGRLVRRDARAEMDDGAHRWLRLGEPIRADVDQLVTAVAVEQKRHTLGSELRRDGKHHRNPGPALSRAAKPAR